MKKFIYPILVALVIFLCSGQSEVATPITFIGYDKVIHFLVFGLLATTIYIPLENKPIWATILAIGLTSLFGLTDEIHQGYTPGRSVDFYDWIADTLGAITAVFIYRSVGWYRRLLNAKVQKPIKKLK